MSDCASNSSWAASASSYAASNADMLVKTWWSGQSSHNNFARQLAQSFGDQPTWFDCGVGKGRTCTISGCKVFQDASNPPWAYEMLISIVNLDTYFNAIYDGVVAGQLDYTNEIPTIAHTFFPPQDPSFPFGNVAPWLVAILAIIFSFGLLTPLAVTEAALVEIGVVTATALMTGAVTTLGDELEPLPATTHLSEKEMQDYARLFGQGTRASISDWANSTFLGLQDHASQSILDYVKGGAFVDSRVLPPPKDIESFYVKQMVSRTINYKWKTQQVFGMFTSAESEDPASSHGPPQTRYYSKEDGGTYYIYQFYDDGRVNYHLDKPAGLEELNGTYFGITGSDISRASAGSFRAGRFNYTDETNTKQLDVALASNNTINPIREGAGWRGTWTLPVCDTGTNNWNVKYGESKLPCCCGVGCKDTKDFIKAANLEGSQTLLRGCYAQLKDSGVDYSSIDYGFAWDSSFRMQWAEWSDGKRAGVTLGLLFASSIGFYLLLCLVAGCCS